MAICQYTHPRGHIAHLLTLVASPMPASDQDSLHTTYTHPDADSHVPRTGTRARIHPSPLDLVYRRSCYRSGAPGLRLGRPRAPPWTLASFCS